MTSQDLLPRTTPAFPAFQAGLETFHELHYIRSKYRFIQQALPLHQPSLKDLNAAEFLDAIKETIPPKLISSENYLQINDLASIFSRKVTSFFGFETRLNSASTNVDYLFAVSSKRGECEALAQMFIEGKLPEELLTKMEWQNIGKFVIAWADPQSILHKKIPGLWFEFDTASTSSTIQVPSIFMQTPNLRIDTPADVEKCTWITQTALPLLTGQPTSRTLEQLFLTTIQHLPPGASVFHVASMLSREVTGIRMVIYKILPNQIIPYLTSLGWTDVNNEMAHLLKDLQSVSSRIILHINITEKGIDSKIGFECAFSKERYHQETKWPAFFDYLIAHNACLSEKKHALLQFFGVNDDHSEQNLTLDEYAVAPRMESTDYTPALVRYLSHIKINYTPNKPIEAKAYPGVRLLGTPSVTMDVAIQ